MGDRDAGGGDGGVNHDVCAWDDVGFRGECGRGVMMKKRMRTEGGSCVCI
jgi:hypothetical protein